MPPVTLIDAEGRPHEMDLETAANALSVGGWRLQTDDDVRARANDAAREETYGGARGTIGAVAAGAARAATLGGSDVVVGALGGREELQGLREVNPGATLAGEILGAGATAVAAPGSLLARTPGGLAAGAGRAAAAGEASTLAGRVALAARGAAVEGSVYGAGQGVSELALSDDPLTVARAASVISSNALYGGGIGALAGGGAKLVAEGLGAASQALGRAGAGSAAARDGSAVADDLAALDTKGLRQAREAELATIEASRVEQRAALADDLAAFRRDAKAQKLFLSTKGATEADVRVLGKRTLKADRQLDNLLDNPKALAQRPERALAALQQQESALEEIVKRRQSLLDTFAGDTSGERAAALNAVGGALERNRTLQARLGELTAAPASPRLAAIQDASDALASAGTRRPSVAQQALGGTAYSATAGVVGSIPVVGPLLAPLIGARASEAATSLVFGGIGKATSEAATRAAAAAAKFVGVAERAAGAAAAAPLTSRVLQDVSFAIVDDSERSAKRKKDEGERQTIASAFRARAREVRELVEPSPDGGYQMRPAARAAVADRLAPVRAVAPIIADRLESHAARRIAYLAGKLPKRPDTGALPHGADRWSPSEIEMRSWARAVAAVEDPQGVLERLAEGRVTPEEADAMRSVHPELLQAHVADILDGLQSRRKKLPYEKRLALSIFSGAPIDPSMTPQVLAQLQASFANEPGTEGGTQAPTPQPQFGSVRAEPGTSAQERSR